MKIKDLVLILLILVSTHCRFILDMWELYSTSFYKCVLGKGYDKITLKLDSR